MDEHALDLRRLRGAVDRRRLARPEAVRGHLAHARAERRNGRSSSRLGGTAAAGCGPDNPGAALLDLSTLRTAIISQFAGPGPELIGKRIGRYTIARFIGKGGMGAVYQAARENDFRMQVAIKLLKPGVDTETALHRFVAERQILAELEHPNIARLLDGGSTDEGNPYLVMEYVEGTRIDTWCDSRQLPVRDRLKLFRQVCAAVQSAHGRE